MDEIESRILDKIDAMREEIVKFHQEIVRIPSVNPPGKYKEISAFVEKKMRELGLETKVKRKNVIGTYEFSEGPSLILYGHADTVPIHSNWTKDPFGGELIEGKIYGRGACDDKACVTAKIFATQALFELGIPLKGKLTLLSVIDEETLGFNGAKYLLDKRHVKGDACLLGDGRGGFASAYGGGFILGTVTITGKKAHSLNCPDLPVYRSEASGINAIHKMVPYLNFFMELQDELLKIETKYPNFPDRLVKVSIVSLAKLQGGEKLSGIPDKCTLFFVINTIPEQDIESIKQRILDFSEESMAKDPYLKAKVSFTVSFEPYVSDTSTRFAKSVQNAVKIVFNEEREFKLSQAASDAHYFHENGIEVLSIGSGTQYNKVHAEDEFIKVEELIETTKLFAISTLNYLKSS